MTKPRFEDLERLGLYDRWLGWDRRQARLVEVSSFYVGAWTHKLPEVYAWLDARVGRRIEGVQTIVGYELVDRHVHVYCEPVFGISVEALFHRGDPKLIERRWSALWHQLAGIAVRHAKAFGPLGVVAFEHALVGLDGKITLVYAEVTLRNHLPRTKTVTWIPHTSALSPGALRGKSTPQDAVFALGAALYLFATGVDPYAHAEIQKHTDFLRVVSREPVPAPSVHVATLPRGFDALVLRALAPDAADRYADPEALIAAAERVFPRAEAMPLDPDEARAALRLSVPSWWGAGTPESQARLAQLRDAPSPVGWWAWALHAAPDSEDGARVDELVHRLRRN